MNEQTSQLPDSWPDCSPAQLAYLLLNGSYGQKLIARRLLEAIAKESPANPNADVVQAFPKGRWT